MQILPKCDLNTSRGVCCCCGSECRFQETLEELRCCKPWVCLRWGYLEAVQPEVLKNKSNKNIFCLHKRGREHEGGCLGWQMERLGTDRGLVNITAFPHLASVISRKWRPRPQPPLSFSLSVESRDRGVQTLTDCWLHKELFLLLAFSHACVFPLLLHGNWCSDTGYWLLLSAVEWKLLKIPVIIVRNIEQSVFTLHIRILDMV